MLFVNDEFENLAFRSVDLVGFLSFPGVPNVQLFVASCAANKLAVGTENDGQYRAFMACIGCFQFAGFRVKNASGAIAARRGDLYAIGTECYGVHPVGMLLDDQLFAPTG